MQFTGWHAYSGKKDGGREICWCLFSIYKVDKENSGRKPPEFSLFQEDKSLGDKEEKVKDGLKMDYSTDISRKLTLAFGSRRIQKS